MKVIVIPTWDEYQHYRDRTPPWIKLHRAMLTSRAWVSLDAQGRELMIALMILAAENDNATPADPGYIQRRAFLAGPPDLQRLVDVGFIEIVEPKAKRSRPPAKRKRHESGPEHVASSALAGASNSLQNAIPETETQVGTETEEEPTKAPPPREREAAADGGPETIAEQQPSVDDYQPDPPVTTWPPPERVPQWALMDATLRAFDAERIPEIWDLFRQKRIAAGIRPMDPRADWATWLIRQAQIDRERAARAGFPADPFAIPPALDRRAKPAEPSVDRILEGIGR